MLLGDLAVVFLVVDDGRVGKLSGKVFVALFELFQAFKHKVLLRGQGISGGKQRKGNEAREGAARQNHGGEPCGKRSPSLRGGESSLS